MSSKSRWPALETTNCWACTVISLLSLNKLMAAFRQMSLTGHHMEWFTRVQTAVCMWEKEQLFERIPHAVCSATQVVSCKNLIGIYCLGWAFGHGLGINHSVSVAPWIMWLHLSPLPGPVWGIPTSGVMILTSGSSRHGPPSSKHISSHIVWGVHIWICNIILSIFSDNALTSASRNVCQLTNLSHPCSVRSSTL